MKILFIFYLISVSLTVLDIQEFIRMSLENSHEIRCAELDSDIAGNTEAAAFGNMLPVIRANFNYTKIDRPFGTLLSVPSLPVFSAQNPSQIIGITPAIDTFIAFSKEDFKTASISLIQPVFWGGKIYNNYRISSLLRESADEYVKITRQNTLLECVAACSEYFRAKELLLSAQNYEQAIKSHLKDVENLYRNGVLIENDFQKTKIHHENALLALLAAENALILSKINLCRLAGLEMTTEIFLDDSFPDIYIGKLDENILVETGLAKRGELSIAQLNLSAAVKRKDISLARFFPDVNFFASLRASNPDFELENEWETGWILGIDFNLSIFEGFGRAAQVGASSSSVAMARENLLSAREIVEFEIRKNILELELAEKKLKTSSEKLASAEEYLLLSQLRFDNGVITNSELLDAYLLKSEAQTDFISAKADLVLCFVELKRSLGVLDSTGIFSPLTEVAN
ncbi:TolC family protein [candidate division WOR-3 bacterium]|nr:TolC family protein [candidate division WOR-3 bacterium]